jgi:alkylhydroperoxidase/carboxymuconolactone decarboxylase family protein YurZ
LGGTRDEVMEVIGMALYMGGGPSLMYGALALEAFDEFAALKRDAA